MTLSRFFALSIFLFLSTPALAHVNPNEHGSFAAGFTHPIFGLDHVLAMIAVGLWAALIGGRAIWALPTAFVGSMVIGFAVSLTGFTIPLVEPLIMTSVLALGAFVALAMPLPLLANIGIVGFFGFCHGQAHGSEIGVAGVLMYALGFVCATALLHASGVLIGYGSHVGLDLDKQKIGRLVTRVLGGLTVVAGLYLVAG